MRAYKFLRDDMRSGYGQEGPWQVGERRVVNGDLELCVNGYHWSKDWFDALVYARGNVAAIVEVPSRGNKMDGTKGCSRWQTLVAAVNVDRELRLFAVDCAERALHRECDAGREPDPRFWAALGVARRYADGTATVAEMDVARAGAWAAARGIASDVAVRAWGAAWSTARVATRDARWAAAEAAAGDAASAAEVEWQRQRLNELLDAVFTGARGGQR